MRDERDYLRPLDVLFKETVEGCLEVGNTDVLTVVDQQEVGQAVFEALQEYVATQLVDLDFEIFVQPLQDLHALRAGDGAPIAAQFLAKLAGGCIEKKDADIAGRFTG